MKKEIFLKSVIKVLVIGLFLLVLFNSCDDTITVEDVDKKVIPDSNVSFSQHLYPVFQVKCAFSGCHVGPNPQAGLDLTTWAGTTSNPNIVFPGNPDLSSMVWTIEALAGFPPMPPIGYRPLTINQINGIKIWIAEGAQNN